MQHDESNYRRRYEGYAVAGYFTVLLKGQAGEAYNVCNTSRNVSIRELADCLAALYSERNIHVLRKERSADEHYTENVLLLGRESALDNTKQKKLGWEAKVDVKSGFDRVVRYIENQE